MPGSQPNLKEVMRKLWTDHAVYMTLVMKSMVDNQPDYEFLLARLYRNQKDIADQLIASKVERKRLQRLLEKHITLTLDTIYAAIQIQAAVDSVVSNRGNDIGEFFRELGARDFKKIQSMFVGNTYSMVMMSERLLRREFDSEPDLYDLHYNNILEMSDMITEALQ